MRHLAILFISIIALSSCKIEPKEINYGKDQCNFCKMTVVDKQHAAEVVTKKGKIFRYDAIECMMRDYKGAHDKVGLFVVNDYNKPKSLIDAKGATFLISKNLPSPMGEFLTAFASIQEAELIQKEKGGDLYNWDELTELFKTKEGVNMKEKSSDMKCQAGKCSPGKCGGN
ncbi:MAG: nitrous oxide reductase accessory protein NosL [Flavobacteriales bacterium]|nr:nitrous oxide reductase accessory protein NosL [Flavobacteriales bacterium]